MHVVASTLIHVVSHFHNVYIHVISGRCMPHGTICFTRDVASAVVVQALGAIDKQSNRQTVDKRNSHVTAR
jgi:hypothetical protein